MPKEWTDIASVGKFKLQRQIRGMRGPHSADSISSSSEKAWFTPVVSGWGLLLIIISMITFGYWFVYYSYLPNNALPAILMFLLLIHGIARSTCSPKAPWLSCRRSERQQLGLEFLWRRGAPGLINVETRT